MEYAILGNAAFFAVAFAMQMGWLSWDMLGFGQDDDDDDVAVKNPGPEPDPEDAKSTNYTASDYASEQVGTSGNDTLGTSSSTESVALFGLTGNDSLVGSSSDDYFEGGMRATIRSMPLAGMTQPMVAAEMICFTGLGGG